MELKLVMEDRDVPKRIILIETESTNKVAKALAREGAAHGTWVMAKRQTEGRGRLGRSFYSPEGGLYLSVVLRPGILQEDLPLMTQMAAVAVRKAVEASTGVSLSIKWVNDLYLGDKKACGILCEAVGDAVIVGVGLNLREPMGGFPSDLHATALNTDELPEKVGVVIAEELLRRCETVSTGDFLKEYVDNNIVCLRDLMVYPVSGTPFRARGKQIDCRGRLIVDTNEGEKVLDGGEVSIRF